MNCKQAKEKLALLIGNDLDASEIGEVQKHLGQCTGCREHLQRLSSCLEVLQVPAAGAFRADEESLWPRISVRLASPSAGQKPHRLSGWGPTLAVAAACAAMFWVASYQFVGDPLPSLPGKPVELRSIEGPADFREQPQPEPQPNETSRMRERKSGTMQMRGSDSRPIPVQPVNERL
jgi:hypothetical protein